MKYKSVHFIDLQKFRGGEASIPIEEFWEEVYSKMPPNLKKFYNKIINENNSISKIKITYQTSQVKNLGSAVPYKFTLVRKIKIPKQVKLLQEYFDQYVLIVDWP